MRCKLCAVKFIQLTEHQTEYKYGAKNDTQNVEPDRKKVNSYTCVGARVVFKLPPPPSEIGN